MSKENRSILKTDLRKLLLAKRKAIPQERREEASQNALETLQNRGRLLSFSPVGSEIDLTLLNESLKKRGLLFLVPYTLDALFHVPSCDVDAILVPGLGFDREHFRLGYGQGAYDRFLATIKNIPTIGIGFKEQLYEDSLPRDPWDIPVQELLLF